MTDDEREDEVDPFQRLRAANPVPPAAVVRLATTARARALRAELTMQTDTPPSTDPESAASQPWRRAVLAGAAVVALALGSTAVLLNLDDGTPPQDVVAGDARVDPEAVEGELPDDTPGDDTEDTGDPMVDPMVDTDVPTGMGLCAFSFSPETLVERQLAFVGTVTAIEGDAITFDVEEPLHGDVGETITLGGGEFLATPNPDNVNPITVGERYLVSGDDGFAWGCGFTHLYDEDVAATWRDAFAG